MATQKELDQLLEDMLNPNNSLFPIVGKRGLDEILGKDYDIFKEPINKIKRDILKLGKKKKKISPTKKKKKTIKANKGGMIDHRKKGTFK